MKIKSDFLVLLILVLSCNALLRWSIIPKDDYVSYKTTKPILSTSQSMVYEWNRTWGSVSFDYGTGVILDSLSNIYLAGFTNSFGEGSTDMALVNYNSNGIQQWNLTWGGSNSETCYGLARDSVENIYLSGSTFSFGSGSSDIALVKYNNLGVQQWNHSWGGSDWEDSSGVDVDSLDNVYVTGTTMSFGIGNFDLVLVKYDDSGIQQWNRTWGGTNDDFGLGVVVDSSDNVYVAGSTNSFGSGSSDIVLVKYNSLGVQQWNQTWGGIDSEYAYRVIVDKTDNLYLIGATSSFGEGADDVILIKYDKFGEQQWNRTWGRSDIDKCYGVALDSSDNIYLTGYTKIGENSPDIFLLKYDRTGVLQWNLTKGGILRDESWDIAIDSLDNIYLAGCTENSGKGLSDMILIKFSKISEKDSTQILGFNLIIIIGLISTSVIILVKKKFKQ
ncbi:MAG: SBBP repeat-containing protein [Promethearchaeota archaeon]